MSGQHSESRDIQGFPPFLKGSIVSDIVIYSSTLCPFCARAKKILTAKGASFEEIDIMVEPLRKSEMIEKSGGRISVPQIFIGDRHIGGCDDLMDLDAQGELDNLLSAQKP